MLKIIQENRLYLLGVTLFIIIGSITLCFFEKGEFLMSLTHNRTSFLDFFFVYTTQLSEEYVYILLILVFLFVRYRYSIIITLTALTSLLVSLGLKQFFAHPRPKSYFWGLSRLEDISYVPGVYVNVGWTSFPSGHTMSAFALYGLLALIVKDKRWSFVFLAIAILVGISRIYLSQHFLQDVLAGAFVGTLIALLVYYLQDRFLAKGNGWYQGNLKELM